MSQKQLAERLDVDPSTLAKWERGERLPKGNFLRRVESLVGQMVAKQCGGK
jgi:transcriptional regulator with XRE-family HTH domain